MKMSNDGFKLLIHDSPSVWVTTPKAPQKTIPTSKTAQSKLTKENAKGQLVATKKREREQSFNKYIQNQNEVHGWNFSPPY